MSENNFYNFQIIKKSDRSPQNCLFFFQPKAPNLNEFLYWEKVCSNIEIFKFPGKTTNFNAIWNLIKSYKDGYSHLSVAIPVTILRGFFFLLICFEVSSVLEVSYFILLL